MKRGLIVVLTVFVALTFFGCSKGKDEGKTGQEKAAKAAVAKELSATIVNTVAGKTTTMKAYMKSDKFRTDIEAAGSSTIVRKDLNKVWMIMKRQKAYMEMEGVKEEQIKAAEEKVKGEISRKAVGSETVDGHPCTKYEVTAKVNDKTMMSYQWWATDINFPVKAAAIDGSWVMEYRDIKLSSQPDSLFEVPAGYKKMTIPGMPPGVGRK